MLKSLLIILTQISHNSYMYHHLSFVVSMTMISTMHMVIIIATGEQDITM